jgi:hypothetical protein
MNDLLITRAIKKLYFDPPGFAHYVRSNAQILAMLSIKKLHLWYQKYRFWAAGSVFVCFTFCSCQETPPDTLVSDGRHLAEITCNARRIREERFKLADAIRFAEDSLQIVPSQSRHIYQHRLDSLLQHTDEMTQKTKIMADSVKNLLAQLHREKYRTPSQRKALDGALEAALKEICR